MLETGRRGVTVVVPVYDDLPSIERCLASVLAHLDPERDELLVINDSGPAADAIEEAVKRMFMRVPSARYVRNPRNLGFVATCNSAVGLDDSERDLLFLNSDTVVEAGFVDELSAVLHASPQHGIVTARSNNATIASIPYYRRTPTTDRDPERSRRVHAALVAELPRFVVAPVAMGFCFFVRRELVREHGLFDEAFSPGYGEENDFCLRMGALGFASLIANRVFVTHVGTRSFGERARRLRAAHEYLLVRRHPHYPPAVAHYLQYDLDPVDRFADVLVPDDGPVSVLLDAHVWGADRNLRATVLAAAEQAIAGGARVTVTAPRLAVRGLRRRHPAMRVIPRGAEDAIFDVAIVRAATARSRELASAHRLAPRWVAVPGTTSRATAASELSGALDTAVEAARAPVDLNVLRERAARYATPTGRERLRRTSLRTRLIRRLEWMAPGVLDAARARRRRARDRAGGSA